LDTAARTKSRAHWNCSVGILTAVIGVRSLLAAAPRRRRPTVTYAAAAWADLKSAPRRWHRNPFVDVRPRSCSPVIWCGCWAPNGIGNVDHVLRTVYRAPVTPPTCARVVLERQAIFGATCPGRATTPRQTAGRGPGTGPPTYSKNFSVGGAWSWAGRTPHNEPLHREHQRRHRGRLFPPSNRSANGGACATGGF